MHNIIKQSEGEVRPNTFQLIETAATVPEGDGQEHPALGGGCLDMEAFSGEDAPRLVIRGESFEGNSNSGETLELIAFGSKGRAKLVNILLPKPDGEPLWRL
jgi:hypothetical protein